MTVPPDTFHTLLQQQVIKAFGLTPDDVEEIFSTEPGSYGAAYLEYQAEIDRYRAELPARYERAAVVAEAKMRADGALPEGLQIAVKRA